MRNLLFVLFFLNVVFVFGQTKKSSFQVTIDQKTIVKDEEGNRVSYDVFKKQLAQGTHTLDPVRNSKGQITHFTIRKKTEEDAGKRSLSITGTQGNEAQEIKEGDSIPLFKIRDLDSVAVTQSMLKGKITVINFWFSLCRPCVNEMPDLNLLKDKYSNQKNVQFWGVNFENKSVIKNFIAKTPFRFRLFSDAKALTAALKIKMFPTTLVIDGEGKIRKIFTGGHPLIGDLISAEVDELLKVGQK